MGRLGGGKNTRICSLTGERTWICVPGSWKHSKKMCSCREMMGATSKTVGMPEKAVAVGLVPVG